MNGEHSNKPADFRLVEQYLQEKKFYQAIGVLEQVLRTEPSNSMARLKLAEIHERMGRWDEALKILEMAGEEHGINKDVSSCYRRINEKKEVYKKVKSVIEGTEGGKSYIGDDDVVHLTKGNISLTFHIKDQDLDLERVLRTLKRIQEKVHEKLAYIPGTIPVEIYNSDTELQDNVKREREISLNSWMAGMYDGTIRINSRNRETPEPQYLFVILSHEYVHFIVDEITNGNCPYWLSEGLALFFSQQLTSDYQARLMGAVKSGASLPLETLERSFSLLQDRELIKLAYAQSLSLVEYFVEKKGWEVVRHMLQQLKNDTIVETLKSLSLNYYLMEKDWLRWINLRA